MIDYSWGYMVKCTYEHRVQGGTLPTLHKEGRWCGMDTYEILNLIFLSGTAADLC